MGVKEKIAESDSKLKAASSVGITKTAVPYAGRFHLLVEEEIRKKANG